MRRQLLTALRMSLALIVILGLAYPLVVTGLGQALFSKQADGSYVKDASGSVVGSSLLGQPFTQPQYFHPRPSAAGDGYDASASGPSNLGPSNPKLLDGEADDPATPDEDETYDGIVQRVAAYRQENRLSADAMVPADAVTASGSGLDPAISLANARLQAPRVAEARGLPAEQVIALIDDHTQGPRWGFLGEKTVNVLSLNLALDGVR
jgi:K+-transporting ATPase ATPase C chain